MTSNVDETQEVVVDDNVVDAGDDADVVDTDYGADDAGDDDAGEGEGEDEGESEEED